MRISSDADPADRRGDRLLAFLGLLDDAAPLFGSGPSIPRAGVLLALPALVQSGVFECAQKIYGSLGPAFYGLRTSILALLLMALWRIKRPEGLKEHSPEALGRVLGLDRAPEVKTLRRKLARLAAFGCATEFGRALAQRRVALRGVAMGFLYIDGHVRVYHGQQRLPKTHVARMRLPMPGTSDYWVNDAAGDPLFVVTAEANAGMAKMLPPVLIEVRSLVGSRRVTVVFDRGGYSPKLFVKILAEGFDLLTYRKGRLRMESLIRMEQRRPTMRGFKIAYGKLGQKIWNAMEQLSRLQKRRAALPRRVPVQTGSTNQVVKLAPERKHLTNRIKLVAYQAESDLLRRVAPHYRRADDEGRTLIQSALMSAADIQVTEKELRVILAPLSSPHRTQAIAALCEELNQPATLFPGSRLYLRFEVKGSV